jgi:ubiquinone/menaquinone biosynthesis C-methylase UbiE
MKSSVYFDPEEQRAVWDSIAKGWTGWRNKERKDIVRFSNDWKPGKILDIGCGNGRNLLYFAKRGFEVYGLDFSKEMVEQAKEMFKKNKIEIKEKQLIVADMRNIPFENENFDYVISVASLHHLPKKDHQEAIEEIKRVLKRNGECIISVWNKYSFKRIGFWFCPKEVFIDWKKREIEEVKEENQKKKKEAIKVYKRYYYLFSYDELKNLLLQNGLSIKKESGRFDENITFLVKKD